jgi:hypothetical protein
MALVRVAGPEAQLLPSSEQRDHGDGLLRALPGLSLLATSALGAVGPYLAVTLGHAGIEGSLVALLMGVAPLFRLLFGPAAGWVADRFHAETRVLRTATGMAALGALGVALAAPTPLGRAAGSRGRSSSAGRVAILRRSTAPSSARARALRKSAQLGIARLPRGDGAAPLVVRVETRSCSASCSPPPVRRDLRVSRPQPAHRSRSDRRCERSGSSSAIRWIRSGGAHYAIGTTICTSRCT